MLVAPLVDIAHDSTCKYSKSRYSYSFFSGELEQSHCNWDNKTTSTNSSDISESKERRKDDKANKLREIHGEYSFVFAFIVTVTYVIATKGAVCISFTASYFAILLFSCFS